MSDTWSAAPLPAETPDAQAAPQPLAGAVEGARTSGGPRRWLRRFVVGVVGLGSLFLLYLLLAAFLPRWWAQVVSNVVSGRFTVGTFFGLFLGFVCTVLPLTCLVFAFRRRKGRRLRESWRLRVALAGLAVLLAAPNLLTLVVVLGRGNAAHAGERIMDVEAPAFRGASLAGVIVAVFVTVATLMLLASRRRNKRKLGSLRDQVRRQDEASEHSADHNAGAVPE